MELYQLAILAVVQGITEFLPISSSGHLVVTSKVLGWPDQGLTIDIALHFGTLGAVLVYFWRDIWQMVLGLGRMFVGKPNKDTKLALNLIVATIPVAVIGFTARDQVEAYFRSIEVVAWATFGFGILLWIVDKITLTIHRSEHLTVLHAAFIGIAQILAFIPGASRAGVTMTAGRLLSMERAEAARFSMLLSIPTIAGISVIAGLDLYQQGNFALQREALIAVGLAFVAGLIAIAGMLRWLTHSSFTPFVIYRLLLGGFLLYWVYA
ncbi:MAG TPA: undecaprenyl-diphosphate phosphatase [Rhodospirillaceae bacterium]|nr:undecaprenyl-diphosphate phosphatase [Rhodospirillaceae bacterium]HAT34244.1 undecaprenyl-diphosphate phosphatase [Rhodospirillaceae bacterium]